MRAAYNPRINAMCQSTWVIKVDALLEEYSFDTHHLCEYESKQTKLLLSALGYQLSKSITAKVRMITSLSMSL